jgi:hypothetical protein
LPFGFINNGVDEIDDGGIQTVSRL